MSWKIHWHNPCRIELCRVNPYSIKSPFFNFQHVTNIHPRVLKNLPTQALLDWTPLGKPIFGQKSISKFWRVTNNHPHVLKNPPTQPLPDEPPLGKPLFGQKSNSNFWRVATIHSRVLKNPPTHHHSSLWPLSYQVKERYAAQEPFPEVVVWEDTDANYSNELRRKFM